MSSPLGLIGEHGSNGTKFTNGKSTRRFDKATKSYINDSNSNYDESGFNPNDNISFFPKSSNSNSSNVERGIASSNESPHTNDIYDVRTTSIIKWSEGQESSYKLKTIDFAYLRQLGVYPNNRLIVCRKFSAGIGNDLTRVKNSPVSTLVTWQPPGIDFFKISFGEEWTQSEATFTKILNSIGEDVMSGNSGALGDFLGGGAGLVPLPGFSELWQRQVMKELGLIDEKGASIVPSGEPNLIKESQRRVTIDAEEAGSGLTCDITIPVKIEYEQKFIGGKDPTKAFYEILANVSRFGTQDSVFYLNGGEGAATKFKEWYGKLLRDPGGAIVDLLQSTISALTGLIDKLLDSLGLTDAPEGGDSGDGLEEDKSADGDKGNERSLAKSFLDNLIKTLLDAVVTIAKKYEQRIMGVLNALTGLPSGPWHVTIGNPKRPLFTSGDMITKEVTITFGEMLAFNDLPSRITVEFSLKNARPLGLQEIMSRFMQGVGRSYVSGPSNWQETSSNNDFNPKSEKSESVAPEGSTQSATITAGGVTVQGSQADGGNSIGATPSNQTYANGDTTEVKSTADGESVKNIQDLTATPTPKANDVNKPSPTGAPNQQTQNVGAGGVPQDTSAELGPDPIEFQDGTYG